MSDAPSAEGQPAVYALPTPEPLPAAWPGALPRPLTPLVGRERELTAIAELLQQEHVRLINLLGPGGTGKTRLALAVATQLAPSFADGVAFTDLSRITDTDLVLPTIALALGVRESGGRSLASQIAALLADRHLLLVIDNCEQVVTAPQITDLLASSPRLKILTTSRAPLRASGEHTFPVPPLTLPRRETSDVRRENEALHSRLTSHVSRLRSGRPLRATGPGRAPRLPVDRRERRHRHRDLPPARRSTACDRVGGRAAAPPLPGSPPCSSDGPAASAHRRSARPPRPPPNHEQRHRLVT